MVLFSKVRFSGTYTDDLVRDTQCQINACFKSGKTKWQTSWKRTWLWKAAWNIMIFNFTKGNKGIERKKKYVALRFSWKFLSLYVNVSKILLKFVSLFTIVWHLQGNWYPIDIFLITVNLSRHINLLRTQKPNTRACIFPELAANTIYFV